MARWIQNLVHIILTLLLNAIMLYFILTSINRLSLVINLMMIVFGALLLYLQIRYKIDDKKFKYNKLRSDRINKVMTIQKEIDGYMSDMENGSQYEREPHIKMMTNAVLITNLVDFRLHYNWITEKATITD